MIVNDLNFMHVSLLPSEANAPLIVDSDRILAPATSLQGFQAEAGRFEVVQRPNLVEKYKSPKRCSLA
jgi:hypothetical protein